MALLPRPIVWLLRVLFVASVIVFVTFFGLAAYLVAEGFASNLRAWTPDNLAYGLAFMFFIIGVVPSFLVAFYSGRALRNDKKERIRGNAAV